jgi:hypothetical protein
LNELRFSEDETESNTIQGETLFKYTIFEQPNKVIFDTRDLSNVSFAGSDISKVTFTDKVKWGGEDGLKVTEQETLEKSSEYRESLKYLLSLDIIKGDKHRHINFNDSKNLLQIEFYRESEKNMARVKNSNDDIELEFIIKKIKDRIEVYPNKELSLELVLYVYRRLRENYEFKLKFDEAGKFFIKEMELKRNYRTVHTKDNVDNKSKDIVKKNNWFRRHFSLTGLYYHFSDYGESIVKPTIIGAITVGLSTLFWLMQSKPTLEPHFFVNSSLYNSTSHFISLNQTTNLTQW